MKQLPRSIYHSIVGDTVTFLETAEETGGKYCRVQVHLPAGKGNDLHYHTTFDEHFTVLNGTLNIQLGKEKLALKAGESYTIPRKALHRFYNESAEPVEFQCVIAPARKFEQILRAIYSMTNDGSVNPKTGLPKNPFHLAILIQMAESYLPTMPLWLQKNLFGALAAIGALLGYKKQIEEYYTGSLESEKNEATRQTSLQLATT